jgi:hypothetical protein
MTQLSATFLNLVLVLSRIALLSRYYLYSFTHHYST